MRCCDTPLGRKLATAGPSFGFHPALEFRQNAYGTGVFSSEPLPAPVSVCRCPYSQAITPTSVRTKLAKLLDESCEDRAFMALYLCLHRLPSDVTASLGVALDHVEYVDTLPKEDELQTPLYFHEDELALLKGTNLHGAVEERRSTWQAEHTAACAALNKSGALASDLFTWDFYLWAATMLSSRAFPSSLIDGNVDGSVPVLFPGIDALNHGTGARMTWLTDTESHESPSSGFTLRADGDLASDQEVLNNYGAKPSEEFILGYGFHIADNVGDVLPLKLAVPRNPQLPAVLAQLGLTSTRHLLPRSGELPGELLAQMRLFLAEEDEWDMITARLAVDAHPHWSTVLKFVGWANEMDCLGSLGEMMEAKLHVLQTSAPTATASSTIRPAVARMIADYRQGQVEIMQAAIEHRDRLEQDLLQRGEAEGVNMGGGDDYDD